MNRQNAHLVRENDQKPVSGTGRATPQSQTNPDCAGEMELSEILQKILPAAAPCDLRKSHPVAGADSPALAHTARLRTGVEALRQLSAQVPYSWDRERGRLELEFQALTKYALALVRINIDTMLSMPFGVDDLTGAVQNSLLADRMMQEIRVIACLLEVPPTRGVSFPKD